MGTGRLLTSSVLVAAGLAATIRGAATAVADGSAAPAGANRAPAAAPAFPRPDDGDLVILDDGTLLAGSVTGTDDEVAVRAGGGAERRFPRAQVSLAWSGGRRVHRGEEAGVVTAWTPALRAAHADRVPTKKLADASPAARAAWWADVLGAAAWCRDRKLRYAGAALLAAGLDEGTWDDAGQALALELEPPEFPISSEDAERARVWTLWARRLVPLAGRFVLKGDAPGTAAEKALWRHDAVVVRTRNLLVWSIDRDVEVLGSVLAQGETTVRALESLLGVPEYGNDEPLEIRLFRDRRQYLTEAEGGRGFAPIWSGGYFAPGEGVSRFYVVRDAKSGAFREEELHETLSHELTHHWLDRRRLRGAAFEDAAKSEDQDPRAVELKSRRDQPGHWIVEGFARFVEDQAVLWPKRGVKFDRTDAECVRDTADALKAGLWIPIERYVDITPGGFEFLSDVPKRGAEGFVNTERGLFYDQGGALVFFLMNRRGPEGAKLLVRYLHDVYSGRMEAQGWKRLGFPSAAELEKEFRAFLAKPSR